MANTLLSSLESILFVSGDPVPLARLTKVLKVTEAVVSETVTELAKRYAEDPESGLMVIRDGQAILLASKPENAPVIEALTKSTREENLSKAALEVLAIVAYRAPVSRAEIDAIRGVNCSFTLRNLLLRDLITREGNPSDNRGYLYRPTLRFLQSIGLGQIEELPDYPVLSEDERLRVILEQETAEADTTETETKTN